VNSVVVLLLVALFSVLVIKWSFPIWFTAGMLFAIVLLKQAFTNIPNTIVLGLSGLMSVYFTYYCLNHLPVKDFRAYAIGKNILEGMSIPEGAPKDSIVMVFQYKKGGEMFEFSPSELPEDLDQYEFVDRIDKVIKRGYIPPILDFKITDASGSDYTEDFLTRDGFTFMLVAYDLNKTNTDVQDEINKFVAECQKQNIPFFGITSTSPADTDKFRHEHQSMFDYYFCDATVLKTIIRSNPGLVLMKKGTVIDMWHHNDFPEFEEFRKKYPE
jgi:hypothetical protein